MRSFAKKLACVLATGSMVVTMFPAAKAQAADEFALNRTSQILYVNEGASYNKQTYDFNFSKAPVGYLKDYGFAWATDKPEVATVQAGGVVTAVGVGKAKISCAVTKKGTTDVVATVTADVEVKANAKTVTVTNAAEYDGLAFEAGDVVDLNRSMTDALGNTSNVRGKVVTDLTRWIAEPATGVEINQANGQFTFTEEADGEYELFCETYQSAAHPEATAKSNSVKVTVNKQAALSVKQNTVKTFTVFLGKSFKSLTVADVTVNRLFVNGDDTYKYPQVVKSVALAADGKSAEVEVFSALANNEKYEVKLTGSDPVTFKASAGKPATMTLSASADKAGDPFVAANAEDQKIYARLFDANGVDVTTDAMQSSIIYEPKTYSDDGSYYVAGDIIWFAKEGLSAVVSAEYMSGEFDENGNAVGNVKAEAEFFAVTPNATSFAGLVKGFIFTEEYDLYNNFDYYVKIEMMAGNREEMEKLLLEAFKERGRSSLTMDEEGVTLGAIVKDSTGKEWLIGGGFGVNEIPGVGTFSFEEVTPNVAALYKDEDGDEVVLYQTGNATFILNLTTADGKTMPVGSVTLEVLPARVPTKMVPDKPQVTIANGRFYWDEIEFKVYDQYGDRILKVEEATTPTDSYYNSFNYSYTYYWDMDEELQNFAIEPGNPTQKWLEECCDLIIDEGSGRLALGIDAELIAECAESDNGKYTFNLVYTCDGVTVKAPITVLVRTPDYGSDKGDSIAIEIRENTLDGDIAFNAKNEMAYITKGGVESFAKMMSGRMDYYSWIAFDCFVMNNGVKKDYLDVLPYPSDLNDAEPDEYYFKVMYNGKDITASDSVWGMYNTVTAYPWVELDLADFDENDNLDELDEDYYFDYTDIGGGTYTLILYKGVEVSGKVQLVQQKQASKTVICTPSSYQFAGRTAESIDPEPDCLDFLECLSFKDDLGRLINAETIEDFGHQYKYDPYFDCVWASDYVRVNYAIFYDAMLYGVTPYKVPVNVTLKINK